MSIKAVTITRQGEPVARNVAVTNDWAQPVPGPGEMLIRTEASALNQLDLWVGRGLPGLALDYPRVGGSDGCGIVEAVGAGVAEAWVGRRVIINAAVPQHDAPRPDAPHAARIPPAIAMIGEHVNGTHAAKFTAPAANALDVGDADPVAAAAFGLVHLTAWRMLWTRARLQPGAWVLITGIGGGVAQALLNIARHLGCRTIVTSRHQWKLDRAREFGADHGVLDTGEDWSKQVRAITGKRGVDVCADSVGKAIHASCIRSLARGGVFVTCGATTGPDATTDLARIFWNQLTLLGSTMGGMAEFAGVTALFRTGALIPHVDTVVEADDAASAYARLEAGEQFGKIVLRW